MLLRYLYRFLLSVPSPRILLSKTPISKLFQSIFSRLYLVALGHSQYWEPEEIEPIQRRRILTLISRAKKSSPFYKKYFTTIKDIENFSSLPPVSKEEMRMALSNGLITHNNLDKFKIPFATSGSTGVPLSFFLDKNMMPRRLAIYRRTLEWVGKSRDDLVIRLFRRDLPGVEAEGILFPCNGLEDLDTKMHQLLTLMKGTIILHGQASVLIRLAQILEKRQKTFKLRAIINASETLHDEARQYLEKVFETRVFDYYGSNEVPAIAQECEYRNGLHVNSEWVYLEIVDDEGRPVAPGEVGNVVITFFENEIVPFIKYQMGDRGYIEKDACPCGRKLPRIHIQGRKGSAFQLPNNKTGYFFELVRPILEFIPQILQYQIIRESKMRFLIKIVPLSNFKYSTQKSIAESFRRYLGNETLVSLVLVDKIETSVGGKQRAFVNLCPDYT